MRKEKNFRYFIEEVIIEKIIKGGLIITSVRELSAETILKNDAGAII
jgi:hypothetical protein